MSNFIILNNQVVESLEIDSIFDSKKYDIFKGVTFSIDQKFAEKYLSNFKETTVVVGIQDSDVQERGLSLEQKQIKQLVDNTKVLSSGLPIKMFENFSRSIQDRILEDSYQLRIPISKTIHTKMYLLKNSESGDTRLIIGSANLSNQAFSNTTPQLELLEIRDNSELFSEYENYFDTEIISETVDFFGNSVRKKAKSKAQKEETDVTITFNVLSLFNFTSIFSIKNIHKYYSWIGVEHLIRYVSGIITVEEFASRIIAAMKKNLSQLIELWVNPKSSADEEAMMFIFPPDFYGKDEIIDCFIKKHNNFNDLINSDILENLLDPKNKNNSYLKSVLEEGLSINHLSKEQFFNLVIMLDNKFKIGGYSELTKKEKLSVAFDYFDDYDKLKLENKKIKPVSLKILQEFYTEDEIFKLAKENVQQVIKMIGESDEDYTNDNLALCLRDGNRKKRIQFSYDSTDENRTLRISEEQLAELKAEFVPMLEKIQDKICYKFNNINGSFDPLIDTSEGFHKAIIKNNSASTFGDLFKLLDWYPESINVLVCADMMKEFPNKIESCSLLSDLINLYGIDTKITLLLPEKFSNFYKENKDKISILLNQMFGDNAEVLLSGFEEHIEKIKSVCSRTSNSSRDLLFKFEVIK